jgi:hypothetical protein
MATFGFSPLFITPLIVLVVHKQAHGPATGGLVARVVRLVDVLQKHLIYCGYYPDTSQIIPEEFPPAGIY